MRNRLISLVGVLLCLLVSLGRADPIKINVGAYTFPPFVNMSFDKMQSMTGMTRDLIDALNEHQSQFKFIFVPTSAKARYSAFSEGKFDVLFFENKKWGWQDFPVDESDVFLTGGEVYIARSLTGRDQRYFDNLKDKRIMAILGYHYGFSEFNNDENFLRDNFRIYLTTSHVNSIRALFSSGHGIADVAVVTKSYLQQFLSQNPEYREKLLVSDRLDQEYRHTILVRQHHSLSVNTINQLLSELKQKGVLDQIWMSYGISPL